MTARTKFYSPNDLGAADNLQRAEIVIRTFDGSSIDRNINDILEFYNIILFFDNKVYLRCWDELTISSYSSIVKVMRAVVGRYIHTISGDSLCSLYQQTDPNYRSDFINVIVKYKVTARISDAQFSCFIDNYPDAIPDIIHEKKLVSYFGNVITERLTGKIEYAELVINHFFAKHNDTQNKKTFMPSELSRDQIELIVQNYVNWDNANVGYLELIAGLKKPGKCQISDMVRLQAHRKVLSFWTKHFETGGPGISVQFVVGIIDQDDIATEHFDEIENKYTLSYSRKWISENTDYPTLLTNYIYLFKYVDLQYRCMFISNPNNIGIIERLAGVHSDNEYATGFWYEIVSKRSSLQMFAYQQELHKYGIEIEDLFKWFFEEYLKTEFGVEHYSYIAPSPQASNLEKILLMASQLDAVLKQYRLFIDYGKIDRELFEFSSMPYRIVDTPSVLQSKYVYPCGNNIKRILFCLFSDQCMLAYPEKTREKYHCFASILVSEDISTSDYLEFLQTDLQWLLDRKVIFINERGFLRIKRIQFNVYSDLQKAGCIALSYMSEHEKEYIVELIKNGELSAENKLFTRQEQAYLDYMLNVKQYHNGPELRNKYVHGSFPLDEKKHENDYMEYLKIMTLIVLKINEEFCLKNPYENEPDVIIC